MQKNQDTKVDIFWIFTEIHSYKRTKSNWHPRTEISAMASLNPKSYIVTLEKENPFQ